MQTDKTAATKKATEKTAVKKATSATRAASPKKAAASSKKAATPKKSSTKESATQTTKPSTKTAVKKTAATKAGGKIKIRFEVFYSTKFGESILISGANPALGAEQLEDAPVLTYIDEHKWAITLEFDKKSIKDDVLNYNYLVRYDDGALTLSAPYQLDIPTGFASMTVRDSWNAQGFEQNAYLTDALQSIGERAPLKKAASRKKYTHRFIITAPSLPAGKAVCLTGQQQELGAWNPAKAILLEQKPAGRWQVDLSLKLKDDISGYKFGTYDLATASLDNYEAGDNRVLEGDTTEAQLLVLQNGFIRTN